MLSVTDKSLLKQQAWHEFFTLERKGITFLDKYFPLTISCSSSMKKNMNFIIGIMKNTNLTHGLGIQIIRIFYVHPYFEGLIGS